MRMMLFIALTGGLLAVIFAAMWAVHLHDEVERIEAAVKTNYRSLDGRLAELDTRIKEAHRLATRAQVEADNALNGMGALALRFDAHRTAVDAHKRLPKGRQRNDR